MEPGLICNLLRSRPFNWAQSQERHCKRAGEKKVLFSLPLFPPVSSMSFAPSVV